MTKVSHESAEATQGKPMDAHSRAANETVSTGKEDSIKPLLEHVSVKAHDVGSGKDVTGGGKDSRPVVEEQLAANSASSTASRHGGSIYDLIVQVNMLNSNGP